MILLILIQNALAISVILGIAFWKSTTGSEAILAVFAGGLLLLGTVLSGTWLYPPDVGSWLYLALFVGASVRHVRRLSIDRSRIGVWTKRAATTLSASLGTLLMWQGVSGRFAPTEQYIDLAAPLERSAGNCVLSGGSSLVHNFHYRLGGDPYSRYEMHAVDFTKKNSLGLRIKPIRALNPQPRDLEAYVIYDEKVFAPCSGEVVEAQGGRQDHLAGNDNRRTDGANYLTLRCGDALVTLAHLRRDTLAVEVGQTIPTGALVGQIGNSGNTEEPHLHLHAQTPPDAQGLSDPIPLRFDGRFLSKGECL